MYLFVKNVLFRYEENLRSTPKVGSLQSGAEFGYYKVRVMILLVIVKGGDPGSLFSVHHSLDFPCCRLYLFMLSSKSYSIDIS